MNIPKISTPAFGMSVFRKGQKGAPEATPTNSFDHRDGQANTTFVVSNDAKGNDLNTLTIARRQKTRADGGFKIATPNGDKEGSKAKTWADQNLEKIQGELAAKA